MDVVRGNAAQVSSDLRQMITGAFDEHKIVIAFPQREIRLDATRPLPVQVVTPPEPLPSPPSFSPLELRVQAPDKPHLVSQRAEASTTQLKMGTTPAPGVTSRRPRRVAGPCAE